MEDEVSELWAYSTQGRYQGQVASVTKWSMRLFEKVKHDNATSGNFTPMKYSVFKTRKWLHTFKDAQQRQTGSIINISSIIFVKKQKQGIKQQKLTVVQPILW